MRVELSGHTQVDHHGNLTVGGKDVLLVLDTVVGVVPDDDGTIHYGELKLTIASVDAEVA